MHTAPAMAPAARSLRRPVVEIERPTEVTRLVAAARRPLTTPSVAELLPPAAQVSSAQVEPLVAEVETPAAEANRTSWAWIRPVVGVAILAFLLWRVGAGPFLDGLRLIDGWALAGALGIGAVTTVACAWRWNLVAEGLGVRLPLRAAVAHCYRSIFLNATLPGGVLGDVHRAVSHGREAGDVSRGIRAVVWERTAGQVVQFGVAFVVLFAFPSPVRSSMPAVAAVVVAVGLGAVLLVRVLPRGGESRLAQGFRTAKADVRDGVLARGNWLRIVIASTVAVVGHLATFLIAANTAGSVAPLATLIPLTLLALLAMGVPANIGGFGPREGVAAWAFAAAGLTAAQGVTTAVVYGALVLASSLPGAVVLLAGRIRVPAAPVAPAPAAAPMARPADVSEGRPVFVPAVALTEGALRG